MPAAARGLAGVLAKDGSLKPFSFKRIHSIDQFRLEGGRRRGNEGRAALPTRTALRGGRWEGARLLKADGARGVDAAGRYGKVFPGAGVGRSGDEEMLILPPRS